MVVLLPSGLPAVRGENWRIAPLSTPRVHRHCPGCGAVRPFASTDRFRLNANKRLIDAWLIYACTSCAGTWNLAVLTRMAQRSIERSLFEAMTHNDVDAARRFAFDRGLVGRAGGTVDRSVPYVVARSPVALAPAGVASARAGLRIRIEMALPCGVRVDRLLAGELGRSRGWLRRHAERGAISTVPETTDPLRRVVTDGLLIDLASPLVEDGEGSACSGPR